MSEIDMKTFIGNLPHFHQEMACESIGEVDQEMKKTIDYSMGGVQKVSFCTEHIESSCYRSHEPCSDTPYNHLHKCGMMKK